MKVDPIASQYYANNKCLPVLVLVSVIPRARTEVKTSPVTREATTYFVFVRNHRRHSEEEGFASLDMIEMEVSTRGFSDQN